MKISDLDLLGRLHDAAVIDITFDMSNNQSRSVTIRSTCHAAPWHEEWANKQVVLKLDEVICLRQKLTGVVTTESIDSVSSTISPELKKEISRLENSGGWNCWGNHFSISFNSGSHIEGICRSIDVELV